MTLGKLVLRYLVFVGVPYLIARRVEKYLRNHIDPKLTKKLSDHLKDIDNISDSTKKGLDNRGGFVDPIFFWIYKIVIEDFAIKTAIAGAVGATIWGDIADPAAAKLAKYGSAILSAPGRKFGRLLKRLKGVNPQHSEDIREILLDHELTNMEKLELLKIKIKQVLKNLKGSKRKQFILFVIATILFSVGGNFSLFAWFMERLRALIGTGDDDSLRDAVIEIYLEYNAPLPKELVEDLPQEIIESIKSLD